MAVSTLIKVIVKILHYFCHVRNALFYNTVFFPSAKTDRMIAFRYFLESLAQCASNVTNFIGLQYSVHVLPSDETSHVY